MSFISMPPHALNFGAGILTILLGAVYLFRTGAIKKDFKIILNGLKKVLSMALIWQGLTLIFLGSLVFVLALFGRHEQSAKMVSTMCAGMLLILGFVTGATGGQSEYILFRIGQFVQVIAAFMVLAGNVAK